MSEAQEARIRYLEPTLDLAVARVERLEQACRAAEKAILAAMPNTHGDDRAEELCRSWIAKYGRKHSL